MTSPLFRPQALAAKRDHLIGRVLLRQPASSLVWTSFAVLSVVAFIVFLMFGHYARRQTVSGHVALNTGVVKLYATQSGVLEHLNVVDGDTVEAGDVLLLISNRRERSDGQNTDAQIAAQLRQSLLDLDAKITQQQALADIDSARLVQQISAGEIALGQLRQRLSLESEKLKLLKLRSADFVAGAHAIGRLRLGTGQWFVSLDHRPRC